MKNNTNVNEMVNNENVSVDELVNKVFETEKVEKSKVGNTEKVEKSKVGKTEKSKVGKTEKSKVGNTEKVEKSKVEKVVKNSEIKNKLYTFDECMNLLKTKNIGSMNDTKNYRIINGKSSIHVKKTKYIIYATTIDFENIKNAKLENIELIEFGNQNDKCRPHFITFNTNELFLNVLDILAKNTLNQPR